MILKVDGQPLVDDIADRLRPAATPRSERPRPVSVHLTVLRDGKEVDVAVTPEETSPTSSA